MESGASSRSRRTSPKSTICRCESQLTASVCGRIATWRQGVTSFSATEDAPAEEGGADARLEVLGYFD